VRKGQRTEKNGVDDTEDGGVGSNTEGESENGHAGEDRSFEKHSNAEADISKECFNQSERPLLTGRFFGLFDATEFEKSTAPGFIEGHTRAKIVRNVEFEMCKQLRIQFPIELPSACQVAEADKKGAKSS
jgi:hypothetical protein